MDIWSWLQEVALLIVVYEITAAESDLLESFRPSADNPPELNEFLNTVLDHKQDFTYVRQAARKYQKMKKDTQDLYDPLTNSMDYLNFQDFGEKINDKRHVYHYNNNANRKFRNLGLLPPNMRNKFNRIRRGAHKILYDTNEERNLRKRFPAIIMLQQEDDKLRKRMQSPVMVHNEEPKIEKHLPSQIFIEPQGESVQKREPERIIVESEGEKGRIAVDEVEKRTPEGMVDQIEGENEELDEEEGDETHKEKKQVLDLDSDAVHHTYKTHQGRQSTDVRNKQGDMYYVDLGNSAEKERERTEADSRKYEWDPRRPLYHSPLMNRMYDRPFVGRPRPENLEYPEYGSGVHPNINNEVAYEKALSYEIEPRLVQNYNNPAGNSLYSVDEGRPDTIQPLYSQNGYSSMGGFEYPLQDSVSNERFYIDADNSMRKLESSTTEGSSTTTAANKVGSGENKNLQHMGNGFIEITKSRRDNEDVQANKEDPLLSRKLTSNSEYAEDADEQLEKGASGKEKNKKHSGVLSKLSLHPLRVKDTRRDEDEESLVQNDEAAQDEDETSHVLDKREAKKSEHFQSRKLQFIDYEMTNLYNDDDNFDDVPVRARRDFLDALGMKNEEDYSEDNPYTDELNVNNTDVHNDTHIHEASCSSTTTTCKPTPPCHRKEDVNNIKQILEETKNLTGVTTVGYKRKAQGKRGQKRYSPIEDSDYGFDRQSRDTNKEMETKISQNKGRIYSSHEASRNGNTNHVQVRREPVFSKYPDFGTKYGDLKKSAALNRLLDRKNENETEATLMPPSVTEKENLPENVNSTYEQIAHQMDVENEKLAQVVNGHLASKIVSKVFCELKRKSCLKAKFYPGLSRKHVNYAGTIDFDIFKTNETEDADEARLLLGQITKVLNRLVLNQVRRKLCQRLPDELKDYLDTTLNVKNAPTLESSNFEPNTQQGDFLFTYHEEKPRPPFDFKQLQSTLDTLENLLLSYHNMNDDCQNRAEPLKEYIEKHVKIAKQMISCPTHNCENKFSEAKRDTPTYTNNALLEKQLHSVGLGKDQSFIPNFDLNQLVRNKMRSLTWKGNKKRDVQKGNGYKTPQFKKLQLAAEKVREKRQNEEKIAEVFGKQKRSLEKVDVDYEEPVVYSLG